MNPETPSRTLRPRNAKSGNSPLSHKEGDIVFAEVSIQLHDILKSSAKDENAPPTSRSKKTPKRRSNAITPKATKTSSTAGTRKRVAKQSVIDVDDSLETIGRRLHTSAVPERLPCRDEQFDEVHNFVQSTLNNRSSRSLYISGIPGTGKTATVHQVIRHLRNSGVDFEFIEVNGMRLTEPAQVYVEIFRQLAADSDVATRISAKAARRHLNRMFETNNPARRPIVLLVDEMDLLCTRRQEILYDIFNWGTMNEARLVVLAIANTLDLPERILVQRVSSRLGMGRVCFRPYSFQQISDILNDRLAGAATVEKDAVEFVSRKVAAVTGDLRTALDIVRRAIEKALEAQDDVLTLRHVQSAVKEMASRPAVEMVKSCSTHSQLLLRAVIGEYERTGHDEMAFSDVVARYKEVCALDGVEALPQSGAYECCMRMASSRLLIAAPGRSCWTRKIRLGLSVEDARFALRHDID